MLRGLIVEGSRHRRPKGVIPFTEPRFTGLFQTVKGNSSPPTIAVLEQPSSSLMPDHSLG